MATASTLFKCPRCSNALQLPVTQTRIPSLGLSNIEVDRTRPRCHHCDKRAVRDRITDIECPPPGYANPLKQLDRTMERVRGLIAAGVRVHELSAEMERMRAERVGMVAQMDAAVDAVWREYWALWDKEDGQESGRSEVGFCWTKGP